MFIRSYTTRQPGSTLDTVTEYINLDNVSRITAGNAFRDKNWYIYLDDLRLSYPYASNAEAQSEISQMLKSAEQGLKVYPAKYTRTETEDNPGD